MKIIVTGCKGQLGTEILKQLREGRSEIGPIPEKLLNATVLPVDLPELDISNYRMVDEFIRRNRPDVIINCAAYTNVDGCEVNHDAAFKRSHYFLLPFLIGRRRKFIKSNRGNSSL